MITDMKKILLGALILQISQNYIYSQSELEKALSEGKATLNARLRYEHAEVGSLDDAEALTIRTRLGYLSGKYYGLKSFLELEDTTAINDDTDYSVPAPAGQKVPGKSIIADPEGTEINRFWFGYDIEDHTSMKIGRQRIILDNARFIGNVGWRQNEQTYDAFSINSSYISDTDINYAYLSKRNTIFYTGIETDSHLFNVSYSGIKNNKITGYAYILDFDKIKNNSSDTFGISSVGSYNLDDYTLGYRLEYANQQEGGSSELDYDADYFHANLSGGFSGFTSSIGYELLGSDNGSTAFKTPLATLHAFNGFADVFLNTPNTGLEDIYLTLGYKIYNTPIKLFYHDYSSDHGGEDFGNEFDLVVSHKFNNSTSILAKFASFNSDSNKPDVDRFWMQLDYKF